VMTEVIYNYAKKPQPYARPKSLDHWETEVKKRTCRHRVGCRRSKCVGKKASPQMDRNRYASSGQRLNILERDEYQCRYCGTSLSNETANMDHVTPWANGGKTKGKNLVSCCRDCNKAKGNQTWEPKTIGYKMPWPDRRGAAYTDQPSSVCSESAAR